ncbi:MAG: hypothetical protein ABR985_02535 [Methanotrichaceae archaeon]|jgi:hypothetical protein
MTLEQAQNILWSLLTPEQKQTYKDDYQLATKNISEGVNHTVLSDIQVANGAPASLYFAPSDDKMPNIIGQTFHFGEETLVVFESKELVDIISLFFGNNVKV